MNKLRFLIIISTLFLVTIDSSHCQETEQKSLRQILIELESRYNVRFSYEDKTVEGFVIRPFDSNLSFETVLGELKKLTGLRFKILNSKFIVISNPTDNYSVEEIQQLQEVLVKNYLTKSLSKSVTGAINFKRSAFDIFPGLIEPDVLQIAQKLPGIISVDEKISNINVRGGTNDQNLILFDGIRMYQSGHFFGLISGFNPYLTETLSITKNGTSAKYGDGVSGLFAIQTSNKLSDSLSGGAGLNMIALDGYAKVPLSKKITLQMAARRSFTDILKSATFNAYFDRIFRDSELNAINNASTQLAVDDNFLFYDVNAKLICDIDDSSAIRVNFINLYNNLEYNQQFTTNGNETINQRSDLSQISVGIGANYSKNWQNGWHTSLETYYSNYDLDASNVNVSTAQSLIQENEIEDYGIRLDVSKTLDRIKFISGYQFNEIGVSNLEEVTNPNFRSFIKEVIRSHALFSEVEWYSNSKNTFLRVGLRGNYFQKFSKVTIEPRVVFNQRFLNHFRFEVIGEIKSQSLNQVIDLQQDFFGIEKRRWQLANELDVPILTSQQVSAGLSYNNSGWLISSEGYYKNVDNITARSQGFQNQFQFVNDIGSYTITGVDLLINKRFNRFSSWLGYSFSTNNYSFNNLNDSENFANNLDLRHVANASLTYSTNRLKFGLALNWHSGRPYTSINENQNPNNTVIEFNSPNGSRLPSYFRTDISAIYSFKMYKNINAEIGASIWNLLNQDNILNRFYTFEGNNEIVEVNNRGLGFTPNFSFRVNF